nr:autoinducer binding domain-containing protein [Ensifer sp. NM-2]
MVECRDRPDEKERRKFFGEAAEFGIHGITIPIKTGFGRMAMLTLASSEMDFAEAQVLYPVRVAQDTCKNRSQRSIERQRDWGEWLRDILHVDRVFPEAPDFRSGIGA